MRKNKKVVISKTELFFIILTLVGAFALFTWQTLRMAQYHMSALPLRQSTTTIISQSQ
jgi:hypothetical protein